MAVAKTVGKKVRTTSGDVVASFTGSRKVSEGKKPPDSIVLAPNAIVPKLDELMFFLPYD